MHPYFFSHEYRERVAEFERQAELRRHFPKRERHPLKRFRASVSRSRRAASSLTEAHPCH